MAERWRKPVIPLAIQLSDTEGIILPGGRVARRPIFTLTEEQIGRMRAGYVCVNCLEPFEVPWPERCNFCGVNVRRDQAAYFAQEYDPGVVDMRNTDWDEELAGLDERRRKQEEEANKNGS